MKTKLKKAWIEDLTSGKFTQASKVLHRVEPTGRSRNKRAGYCCLGVLSCRIAKLKAVKETGWRWDGVAWRRGEFEIDSTTLPRAVEQAIGLLPEDSGELVTMNDGQKPEDYAYPEAAKTFRQIAKWIEKNVEETP